MNELSINRQEIPIGSVVYFLTTNQQGRKTIKFGTVEEHYTYEICLQLYDFCERRMIDGVPVEQIETPTRWQKLPKGWTYDTRLYELDYRPLPNIVKECKLNNPADVLRAIEQGVFVKVQTLDYGHFEDVIDKEKGWRLERKYPYGEYHPAYTSVRFDKVYTTYEETKAVLDAELAEFARQAELSDYDWSVEQIDKELNRWAKMYGVSDEEKKKYRDWLLALDNVEDVEVRFITGGIQWKYWKNKRWMNIEI